MDDYELIVDAWRYFKRYKAIAAETEEFYDAAIQAAENIYKTHNSSLFAMDLLAAILSELERETKRKKKERR